MTEPLFRPYRGPLTPAQALQGIRAAHENAKRLLDDARALAAANRSATALGVAVLAAEEASKQFLLLYVAASHRGELGSAWKNYRSHVPKSVGVVMAVAMRRGAKCLADLAKYFDDDALLRQPDAYKQLAFYSECVEGPAWAEPIRVISPEMAAAAIQYAADVIEVGSTFDEEAVAAFVQRVGPALRLDDQDAIMRAYRQWATEMISRTTPESNVEELLQFLSLPEQQSSEGQPDTDDEK